MSSFEAPQTTRGVNAQDLELFTTPATDPAPDRHPSVLRPGGHASPLKFPTALRPGAGRQTRTPSPNAASKTSPQHSPYSPPPPVAYKAYSPPRVQSPSDELSAEIEGYFTALEVAPLKIKKQGTPEPSGATAPAPAPTLPPKGNTQAEDDDDDLYVRCASPPVPPKERIEEMRHHAVSPVSELEAPVVDQPEDAIVISPMSEPAMHVEEEREPSTEPPPAYDESERVNPPPEKSVYPRRSGDGSLAGSAAASAAQVGGAVAGLHPTDAAGASSSNENVSNETPAVSATPPPLPPRHKQNSSSPGKGKTSTSTPSSSSPPPAASSNSSAFPPPPAKPVAQSQYKAGGAAATSAANVGAAVAGVGQSAGLTHARKALEKRLGHLVDKAKEHHQQLHQHHQSRKEKEQHGHAKKASDAKGKKKASEAPCGGAEDSYLAMKAEGDYLYS